MGVDFDGVGGVGILVDGQVVESMVGKGIFTLRQWEEDEIECAEETGMMYSQAGSWYTGVTRIYFFVEGDTLEDVWANKDEFVQHLSKIGVDISLSDIKIIQDKLLW